MTRNLIRHLGLVLQFIKKSIQFPDLLILIIYALFELDALFLRQGMQLALVEAYCKASVGTVRSPLTQYVFVFRKRRTVDLDAVFQR